MSADKLFPLEEVNTQVTQPVTQVAAQSPLDTTARNQQLRQSISTFGNALSNLAEYSKRKRIADDINTAQIAAVKNEVMPGGLLPVAQQAFRNTQDIDTVNKSLVEAKIFADSQEVKDIVNNHGATVEVKNQQLTSRFDLLFENSSSSLQNPQTIQKLKAGIEGLKLESLQNIVLQDQAYKEGVSLSALSGEINNAFEQKEKDPSEVFTIEYLQKGASGLRKALPWEKEDDTKLATFNLLVNHPEMINHPDIVANLMKGEFSKGVTFNALAHAQTTDAGKEIYKIYDKYLKDVDASDKAERLANIQAQNDLNDNGIAAGTELLENLENPGDTFTYDTIDGEKTVSYEDRFKALREVMIDQNGAEISEYNSLVRMWTKSEGYTKNGIWSDEYATIERLIYSGAIRNTRILREFVNAYEIEGAAANTLSGFLNDDRRQMLENINRANSVLNFTSSNLISVLKDSLKPDTGIIRLLEEGLSKDPAALNKALNNKNSAIRTLLGRAHLNKDKYIDSMRLFAEAKKELDSKVREESRRAIRDGEVANFDKIQADWERETKQFMDTLDADLKQLAEGDVKEDEEAKEIIEQEKQKRLKEIEDKKSPEQKQAEKAFDQEVKVQTAEEDTQKLEEQQKATKENMKEIEQIRADKALGITGVTPEVRKKLSNFNWFGKDYIPPSLLKWGLDTQTKLPEVLKNDLQQAKEFWTNWPNLKKATESDTLFKPFGMQLEEEWKEKNKLKYDLLEKKKTVKEVGDELAQVHDDWNFFGTSVADAAQGDDNFDPSKPLTMEEVDEYMTLAITPTNAADPDLMRESLKKPIAKKRGKNFGGMAGETGDMAKTDIVQTVKKKYRKDVVAKAKQIALSDDFKANILLLEGHKPDAKIEDKGGETVGAYGINLETAKQLLNDSDIAINTTLSTTQINTAVSEFRKIVQSQIKELENKSDGKLKFTTNEKKALELTLWNIGQYALGSKADTRARKAFIEGNKKTGFHEIYSKAVGFNKANKTFKEGLHNRRVIEQLIARLGSL